MKFWKTIIIACLACLCALPCSASQWGELVQTYHKAVDQIRHHDAHIRTLEFYQENPGRSEFSQDEIEEMLVGLRAERAKVVAHVLRAAPSEVRPFIENFALNADAMSAETAKAMQVRQGCLVALTRQTPTRLLTLSK